jgi:hypothetical protein
MSDNTQPPEKFKGLGLSEVESLNLALDYLDTHYGVRSLFPIRRGAKFPPCVKDNLDKNASSDPEQIRKWSAQFKGCNWGLAHRKSRVLVVDVDTNPKKQKQGQFTYDALALAYGWPDTEKTTTPSGGFHLIYEGWGETPHIFALGLNGLGLDVDSPNYSLIPGCMFDDGTSYVGNGAPSVKCPAWIYDTIRAAKGARRGNASTTSSDASPLSIELIERMLARTPYVGGPEGLDDRRGYDGWVKFMMSVHEASNGSADGLAAFAKWSQADEGYTNGNNSDLVIQDHWDSFNADAPGGRTRKTWTTLLAFFPGNDELVSEATGGSDAADDFADDPPEQEAIEPEQAAKFERDRAERADDKDADDFRYGVRPRIDVTNIAADLPKLARKVQNRFVKAVARPDAQPADQVFNREGELVHLSRNKLKQGTEEDFDKNYHVENELLLKIAEPEWFMDTLERHFEFYKMGKKKGDSGQSKPKPVPVGAPPKLVNRMFSIKQDWVYPKIRGTVETPTLRSDGTILDKPGFDKQSGLYHDPGTMTFPPIEQNPTLVQRKAALAILKEVYSDFPFCDEEDGIKDLSLSVALAMPLTGIMRRTLPTAPMFGIDATQANTGKTALAQVTAIIMTGRETAVRVFPTDDHQCKAELAAAFEAGDAMILYDNIDGDKQTVEGASLCAALTSERIQARRYGSNSGDDQIMALTNSLMACTGNGLLFEGDMTDDRGLKCTLRTDQKLIDRKFSHWPLNEYLIKRRPTLVAACLTILRGHIVDQQKKVGGNFRFPEWRSTVADALVGLGLPDPTLSCARFKSEDPRAGAQREVMRSWVKSIGEQDKTISEALPLVGQAIADALGLPDVKKLTTKAAVNYLKGMCNLPLLCYRLMRWTDDHTKSVHYQAKRIDPAAAPIVEVESPPTAQTETEDFGFEDAAAELWD